MIKYSNFFILFILLSLGVVFQSNIHISTNLLSLFASKEAIEKFKIADNLGYSKEMFIVVKGFDETSKTKVRDIAHKIKDIKDILSVHSTVVPPKEVQQYYKKYYPILADFDDVKLSKDDIKIKLQALYDSLQTSAFYISIDKNDPLKLFELQGVGNDEIAHKGEFITLGDYGYIIRVSTDVSASQMGKAKALYDNVHTLLSDYDDVISFAPFYYTVENSAKIKNDVKFIVILSSIILFIIYYLLIKNLKLLSHTLVALLSSMIFAGLLSTTIFSNFNALSLAFGMSITAVSIDYLLHYYFHDFYQNKKKIDRNVLYGYLTTTVAFGIFSFIPIPIISQISFFTVASLSFAYVVFTFIFPMLNISANEQVFKIKKNKTNISSYLFFVISIALFTYSIFSTNLDNNIKNLDYQNTKLRDIQKMLHSSTKTKLTPVIVKAQTTQELLDNLHLLKDTQLNSFSLASFIPNISKCKKKLNSLENYDFASVNLLINEVALDVGFRDAYFKDSYTFVDNLPSCNIENFDSFKSFSLNVYKDEQSYYTIALLKDAEIAIKEKFASSLSAKDIFAKLASQMYKDLLIYSLIVLVAIFTLLILSVKSRFVYALNYILFPMSLSLSILSSFVDINIMHIFSLIILIAIGIDYGIYMSNTNNKQSTIIAIRYSLLSTFAAFGVLMFSSIVALKSIGIVISIGAISIFILIRYQK